MATSIPVPLLLQRDKARQLNELLFEKSGCFAFLKTGHILLAENPTSYCDAFTIYAIGLYVLYHDYGCRFLHQLLSEAKYHPLELDVRSIPSLLMHSKTVQNTIRPNVAHGVYRVEQREEIRQKIEGYYLHRTDRQLPTEWDNFTGSLTESDWETITRRLVRDADRLYSFLERWANAWAGQPEDAKNDLRKRFGGSFDFAKSFDKRICSDILRNFGKEPQSFDWRILPRWQSEVAQAFISYEVTTPAEVYAKLQSVISAMIFPPTPPSSVLADKHGFGIPTIK